jgi:phage terminase large subunit-like protein
VSAGGGGDAPTYTTAAFKARWAEVKRSSSELRGLSLAQQLAILEDEAPGTIGELLDELEPNQWAHLAYDAGFWLRDKQMEILRAGREGGPLVVLYAAGRGNGKTRTASEWALDRLAHGARTIVIVGPSFDDVREFMVGGNKRRADGANGSGLLDCLPPWVRYVVKVDERLIEFPDFHAQLRMHSAEVPEYRGPEPDSVWGDELIKWRYPERLLSNLRLACRAVGKLEPMILLTTSPKRMRVLRDLVMDDDVLTLHAHADENVGNTHEGVYASNLRRLTDPTTGRLTRQGEEELGGELGVDEEGDLFPLGLIEETRVETLPGALDRIVVSIDPAGTRNRTSDETGIVALGRAGSLDAGHGYVLDDGTGKYQWEAWGDRALVLAEKWGASAFVLERNKFADAVAANIRTTAARRGYSVRPQPGRKHLVELVHDREGLTLDGKKLPPMGRVIQIIEVLQSASTGDKRTRAQPVATLYQTRRIHHLGVLPDLDAELSDWQPENVAFSPGRVDAVVNGLTELFELDRAPERRTNMVGLVEANERLDRAAPAAPSRSGAEWRSVGRDRRRTI